MQQLQEMMTSIQNSEDTTETIKRGRVSSNTPPMNTKKQKEVDYCVRCNELAVEDALECVWCKWWENIKCIKISVDQYAVLSNIPSNIVFFAHNVYSSYQVH